MINFFKTKNRQNLEKPLNQTAEVLYELINKNSASRIELMEMTGCLNITAVISRLRLNHEILVNCDFRNVINKFGRPVKYGIYTIKNKSFAIEKYKEINKIK